jgi:rod shape-determining protein MreB
LLLNVRCAFTGLNKLMTKELGVPAYRVDNPTTCTAEGAARALAMYPLIRRNLPAV